jgi:hypothetical protein
MDVESLQQTKIEETVPPKSEEVKKICQNIKTYYRKSDGVMVVKVYDQTPYSKKYYEKNKASLKEYVDCSVCGHRYQKWNKSHHTTSKKHSEAIKKEIEKKFEGMILKNDANN